MTKTTNKTGRKHAKVECSTCGKLVAYSSLKRHQGRRECAYTYLANTLMQKNAFPERHVFLGHYHIDGGVLPLLVAAGVTVQDSMIKPAITVDKSGSAQIGWHVPRWLVLVVRALEDCARTIYKANRELEIARDRVERAAKDPLSSRRGPLYTEADVKTGEALLEQAKRDRDARLDEAVLIYKHATDEDKYTLEIEIELGVSAPEAVTKLAARLQAEHAGC